MRMKFKCLNCEKVFFLHERLTRAIVRLMEARQNMYKVLWNKDFNSEKSEGINEIMSDNACCCGNPNLKMLEFHGFE